MEVANGFQASKLPVSNDPGVGEPDLRRWLVASSEVLPALEGARSRVLRAAGDVCEASCWWTLGDGRSISIHRDRSDQLLARSDKDKTTMRTALLVLGVSIVTFYPGFADAVSQRPAGGANQADAVEGVVNQTLFNGEVRLRVTAVRNATDAERDDDRRPKTRRSSL
jgi:hypothetical protein